MRNSRVLHFFYYFCSMKAIETVKHYIEQNQLIDTSQKILCALSGGADSVCLLRMMLEMDIDVEAVHCNFHLRGEESMRDEVFVQNLCSQLGVPLHVQNFDTAVYAREHNISIEMAAREQRYELFENMRKELHCQYIAVAHHRDDNVETMLLNLLRGTGLKGLCGMQPRQGNIIRPLLCLTRQDILDYLSAFNQDYITDSTNLCNDFTRNKIRLDVMPLLRSINPSADDVISDCMENLNEAWRMYHYCVNEFVNASIDGADCINIDMVLKAPSPLSVLHEILSPFGFNRSQLKDILRSIHYVGRYFHSSSHRVLIDRESIVIETLDTPIELPKIAEKVIPRDQLTEFSTSSRFAYFDADKIRGGRTLRLVQEGDRFHPFGMKGTKLVSDYLTDLKLSRTEKEHQFVLLYGDEIAWVVGRRTSNLFRVDSSTENVIVMELTN